MDSYSYGSSDSSGVLSSPIVLIIVLILFVLMIITTARIYHKAGQPGWASVIPIYNLYILLKIVNKPVWWIILCFMPLVSIVINFFIQMELGKVFGKSKLFSFFFLWLFPLYGYPSLAFGDATYMSDTQKTNTQSSPSTPTSPNPAPPTNVA